MNSRFPANSAKADRRCRKDAHVRSRSDPGDRGTVDGLIRAEVKVGGVRGERERAGRGGDTADADAVDLDDGWIHERALVDHRLLVVEVPRIAGGHLNGEDVDGG